MDYKDRQTLSTKVKGKVSFRKTFAALKHRNYKLWFWGQMISLFGSWMQTTAQGYLVFELTRSPVFLGYVGFAAGIPSWLFTIYGGVIADRAQRRTILLITQVSMMILAAVLAALTFTNTVQAWHVIVLAFGLGTANAFDAPARQAFVLELIEREDLMNAIALNSTMFNTATAVGPAVAGITYAWLGPAWCFTINALSFIGVITALLMMRLNVMPKIPSGKSPLTEMKEGFLYMKSQSMIMAITILVTVTGLFGVAFATLIPAWAVKILHGNATTNGIMQSARGLGALMSALAIASFSSLKIKGKVLTTGTFAMPVFLAVFAIVRWLPLSLIFLVGVGAATIMIFNLANGMIQSLVSDEFRGRVMGIYSFTFFGFMPVGALFYGTLAEHLGEPEAILINAFVLIVAAVLVRLLYPKLSRVQ